MDENTLSDLLECSVCLERLESSSKVLPCQHTFCRKCLEVIVASHNELRCPECRVLVNISIDDLPPNVLLMRILEGIKNATSKATSQQTQFPKISIRSPVHNTVLDNSNNGEIVRAALHPLNHQPQNPQNDATIHQQQMKYSRAQQQYIPSASVEISSVVPRRTNLPHAYALFDFTSSEASDLKFKKGDLILLKRKVDQNWLAGQCNGADGTFPVNYVKIIVPLPTPRCLALYDFKMGPNEEEGCLAFKKGQLINVLRRVDQNWAEGCIGSTIGIFPIAFVELNSLAKQLLETPTLSPVSSTTRSSYQPRVEQGINANGSTVHTTEINSTKRTNQLHSIASSSSQSAAVGSGANIPPIPMAKTALDAYINKNSNNTSTSSSSSLSSNAISSVSTSSTITTASNSSNSNSSASSMPNSPEQSVPNTPQRYTMGSGSVRYRNNTEKRHSLNALLLSDTTALVGATPAFGVLQSNRHSAEILSIPSEELVANVGGENENDRKHQSFSVETAPVAGPQTTAAREFQNQSAAQPPTSSTTRINVLKTNCGQPNLLPILPWSYLALFPYKPLKKDELELKKGCVYIVTERCLDGWYKGKNWLDQVGVFPGNYVTPLRARDQQQLIHQWKCVPMPHQQHPLQAAPLSISAMDSTTNNDNPRQTAWNAQTAKSIQHLSSTPLHQRFLLPTQILQPPDLPPRHLATASTIPAETATTTSCAPFFNRCNAERTKNPTGNPTETKEKQKEVLRHEKDGSSTTNSASAAALNLMKRLTNIKSRAKSPANNIKPTTTSESVHMASNINTTTNQAEQTNLNYLLDNRSCQDNVSHLNNSNQYTMHPVHVRSGSCPSQLLQSLPAPVNENVHSQSNLFYNSKIQHAGSQRIKGNKERISLHSTNQCADDSMRNAGTISSSRISPITMALAQSVKSPTANIYSNKCSQQQQRAPAQPNQQNNHFATQVLHRKSQSFDANTLISSAHIPSNTSGATIATPCSSNKINTAAITASATTKSTQSGPESRFRCIVPYPPNSNIELELHVGDIIYVQRKQKNGWYKGTHSVTQKTGLFPASFVEPDL